MRYSSPLNSLLIILHRGCCRQWYGRGLGGWAVMRITIRDNVTNVIPPSPKSIHSQRQHWYKKIAKSKGYLMILIICFQRKRICEIFTIFLFFTLRCGTTFLSIIKSNCAIRLACCQSSNSHRHSNMFLLLCLQHAGYCMWNVEFYFPFRSHDFLKLSQLLWFVSA